MKTFLGFTTGILTGFVMACATVAHMAVYDPEKFKNVWLDE